MDFVFEEDGHCFSWLRVLGKSGKCSFDLILFQNLVMHSL